DRDLDVVGHQALQYLLGSWLVLDERPVLGLLFVFAGLLVLFQHGGLLQRQQRLTPDYLRDRRDVAVVEDLDTVEIAVHIGRDQALGDRAGVGVGRAIGEAGEGLGQLQPAEDQRGGGA